MNGEVRTLKEKRNPTVQFSDLVTGEGVTVKERPYNQHELRIKISSTHYIHFSLRGKIFLNKSLYWPEAMTGKARKFKLIAEEV